MPPKARPVQDRIKDSVLIDDQGCWLWTKGKYPNGYAMFGHADQRIQSAHRASYEAFVGAVPAGLELDHVCRVRHCVNPAHLEAVTHAENMRRACEARTHCPHGHEYTPENIVRDDRHPLRKKCRECARARRRAWGKRRVEARAVARAA